MPLQQREIQHWSICGERKGREKKIWERAACVWLKQFLLFAHYSLYGTGQYSSGLTCIWSGSNNAEYKAGGSATFLILLAQQHWRNLNQGRASLGIFGIFIYGRRPVYQRWSNFLYMYGVHAHGPVGVPQEDQETAALIIKMLARFHLRIKHFGSENRPLKVCARQIYCTFYSLRCSGSKSDQATNGCVETYKSCIC